MTNSRDRENGGPEMDRRGVERDSPLQQERNVMRKKLAIAVVALLAGALMLPNHEALARGGGGGGHGGALAEVASTGVVWEVVSTAAVLTEAASAAEDLAAEDSVTLQAAGDLTIEDLAAEDSGASSAAASEIMDFMAVIPIRMTAILITTTTTGAIIRDRVRPGRADY